MCQERIVPVHPDLLARVIPESGGKCQTLRHCHDLKSFKMNQMKNSYSMSSLVSPSKVLKTPENAKTNGNNPRLCHSLNVKKPRRLEKKHWRCSWGSMEDKEQEEFWKLCMQSVQGLAEVNSDEQGLKEFLELYTKICEWLNSLQNERGKCGDARNLNQLRLDLQNQKPLRLKINEEAKVLMRRFSKFKEEFHWRIKHINSQWDALDIVLSCQNDNSSNTPTNISLDKGDSECDIEWLRNWLRKMESELQPLDFRAQWSPQKIHDETFRYKGLQKEVDEKSSAVHAALRQSKSQGRPGDVNGKRTARLEKRWHQLRLRLLEWVEHLGWIQEQRKAKGERSEVRAWSWESDEENNEPLRKNPRIGDVLPLSKYPLTVEETNIATLDLFVPDVANVPNSEEVRGLATQIVNASWTMGQSDETESSFTKSSSPIPNSVIEFTFDGTTSVGMKRKLSGLGGTLPLGLQVVPRNISTYYFKHSDTEPEVTSAKSEPPSIPALFNSEGRLGCQKELDFGQDSMELDGKCSVLSDEISFGSFDLDNSLLEFGGEDEDEDLHKLNEIVELVEKAEWLVKPRGVQLTYSDEEEEGASEGQIPAFSTLRKCSVGNGAGGLSAKKSKPGGSKNNANMEPTPIYNDEHEEKRSEDPQVLHEENHQNKIGQTVKKKSARVRQWIRAHNNTENLSEQKNTSSCDASAESTSESEGSSSESELPLSSDDPTNVSTSTFLQHTHALLAAESRSISHSQLKGSSGSSLNHLNIGPIGRRHRSPSGSNVPPGVIWRSKKRTNFIKQRPKSFTDTLFDPEVVNEQSSSFVSDPALNLLGKGSGSGSWSSATSSGPPQSNEGEQSNREHGKKNKFMRKKAPRREKRKSFEGDENEGFVRSQSFYGSCIAAEKEIHSTEAPPEVPDVPRKEPKSSRPLKPSFLLMNSDNSTPVHLEELNAHDEDWDSYQEKYLSEPYSEEPYDPDRTLKLLAFGEDYGQYLDKADSECSSISGGFEPNPRKRRPLIFANRTEMPESDSDREELNYLLSQSASQLRFVNEVFRKQLVATSDLENCSPSEYAEMKATCEENINSLSLILRNIEKPEDLLFEIDVKSIEGILERWHILKEKIVQATKLQQIQEEMDLLKKDFNEVHCHLGLVDPFDANNLVSLQNKIGQIQGMLANLTERKEKLQALNEASVGTQLFLKEADVVTDVREQLHELYALYEENFQLGAFLLEKMKFLQEAWEKFEWEKNEFEKSMNFMSMKGKMKKDLSCSAASSDSGHGTDFSHDSSISDSDMDFHEKREKLVALKKRATDLKAFLPPGSPALEVIDQKINEAQRGFEEMRNAKQFDPLDLKIIYPKKRSPIISRRTSAKPKLMKSGGTMTNNCSYLEPSSSSQKTKTKKWRIVRLTLTFHLALMGLLAAAYFFQPKCCEYSNTFCFSLSPHLTHESLPPI